MNKVLTTDEEKRLRTLLTLNPPLEHASIILEIPKEKLLQYCQQFNMTWEQFRTRYWLTQVYKLKETAMDVAVNGKNVTMLQTLLIKYVFPLEDEEKLQKAKSEFESKSDLELEYYVRFTRWPSEDEVRFRLLNHKWPMDF